MKRLPILTKLKKIDGRVATLLVLVALLVAVSYLGHRAQPVSASLPIERVPLATDSPASGATAQATAAAAQAESDFETYRAELEQAREQAAALLDEVIQSPGASAQTVEEALRQKTELARTREIETTVETLLAARGFDQTLCTVRQGSVNIVVRAQSLTQQQAAQILDIAVSESGEPAANVRIVPAQ